MNITSNMTSNFMTLRKKNVSKRDIIEQKRAIKIDNKRDVLLNLNSFKSVYFFGKLNLYPIPFIVFK